MCIYIYQWLAVRSLAIASLLCASGFPPTSRFLLAQVHIVWVATFCCITWSMRPLISVRASSCCCSQLSNSCLFSPALSYNIILPLEERCSAGAQGKLNCPCPAMASLHNPRQPKVQPKITGDKHPSVFMHSVTLENQSKNHNLSWLSPNSPSKNWHCLLPCLMWLS